jgi:hypothetical protein
VLTKIFGGIDGDATIPPEWIRPNTSRSLNAGPGSRAGHGMPCPYGAVAILTEPMRVS